MYSQYTKRDVSQSRRSVEPFLEYISVNIRDIESAINNIIASARAKLGFCFFTLNLDHLVKLETDTRFGIAYRSADFISADGWPIVWLLGRRGESVRRTTGADLVEPLCASAAEHELPIYFIGPGPEPQRGALEALQRRHPDLKIAGAESPTLSNDFSDEFLRQVADRLLQSQARLCFVSLGAPKQELLADALRRRCPEVGFLCVGAALDFISGHAARAPRIAQALRLEWAWRMARDPRRLGPRYLKCLIWFAFAAGAPPLRDFASATQSRATKPVPGPQTRALGRPRPGDAGNATI